MNSPKETERATNPRVKESETQKTTTLLHFLERDRLREDTGGGCRSGMRGWVAANRGKYLTVR